VFNNNLITKFNTLETPFYYYDLNLLENTLKALVNSKYNNFYIHYAIKANNNNEIIKRIKKFDLGIDAVSGNEIIKALDLDFDPKKIVFSGVGKTQNEIQIGVRNNIYSFNCESLHEIELINIISKKLNRKSNIAIRLNPNIDSHSHKYMKTAISDSKFGIQISDLPLFIDRINQFDNVSLIGFHFHIGSQITDLDVFLKLSKIANDINLYFKENNILIKDINLGGGLGIDYGEPDKNLIPNFNKYFDIFKKELKLYKNQKIHFELGRSIVGQSGTLVSKVLYIKKSFNKKFIIIDAGMTELIRPALYNSHHHIQNLMSDSILKKYDIVGPLCESSDTFIKDFYLNKTKINDLLAIRSVGAYGEVMSSNYNLRKKASSYYSDSIFE